jgi:hypothetical protein
MADNKSKRTKRVIEMAGQRFGRLSVIEESGRLEGQAAWMCQCDCGAVVVVRGSALRKRVTKSCGCLSLDMLRARSTTHNQASTREYAVWRAMLHRCFNPRATHFDSYGGRGITVCDEWRRDFSRFIADMGPRPVGGTLDRRDNNGNYTSDNCRWATRAEQANNKRSSHLITWNGETHTICEWATLIGVTKSALSQRLVKLHWTVERAMTTPQK